MNSWIKLLVGEKMPDINDPKYEGRRKRDQAAGKKFADVTGISKGLGMVVAWAEVHKKTFLVIVFGFVLTLFVLNLSRLVTAYNHGAASPRAAVIERVDSVLAHPRHSANH